MMGPIFITGNQNKADQLAGWLDMPMERQKVDLDEIQSSDLATIVADKAKRAYDIIGSPVLVEDVSLTFTAMVSLPGPFIKWFEEPGIETLCRMLDGYSDRRATARTLYGLYDGKSLKTFEGVMTGTIADKARGNRGFGFDPVFINDGQLLTRAEMDEATYADTSYRKQAVEKLKQYLHVRD